MPFELKNAGATYQRLMTKIFKPLIDRTVEVYINDFVVKSKTRSEHAQHLEETFLLMRAYNMKLNSTKCAFGVNTGKFLRFMVIQRGIEVNLDQIKVVLETPTPGSKKELQRLTGRLAALERFITLFTDKLRSCLATNSEVSGSRVGLILHHQPRVRTSYSTRLSASNNEVEYEAILARLDLALTLAAVKLKICSDSQLVIEQIQKEYEAKDERMACYLELVQDNLAKLGEWAVERVPRTENSKVDALAEIVATLLVKEAMLLPIYLRVTSLIATTSVCSIVETNIDWTHEIGKYLRIGELAGDEKQAHKIQVRIEEIYIRVTDYVSKWVETKAYVSIKDKDVSKLNAENIASRFGIPQSIVADNGLQFDSIAFKTFCSKPTRTTHFALAYGMEAIIPTEIGMPITKIIVQGQMNENQDLEKHLDWADEVKGNANIWMTSYQQRAITHYNKKARPCVFRTKTLVLRRVFENMTEREVEKLQENWEGPYVVTKVGDSRAYHLQTLDVVSLLHPWNISNLKQYYQ
ncbi:hypothetical protein AAG906_032907 [Vitis piasezkii]